MGQLAIVVKTQSLNTALIVLVKFYLMLNHFNSCFEDAFVFDRLSNLNLASASAFALRGILRRRTCFIDRLLLFSS